MTTNPLLNMAMQVAEMQLYAKKLETRLSSMNVGRASDPATLQQVSDDCRREAREEISGQAGITFEIPLVTSSDGITAATDDAAKRFRLLKGGKKNGNPPKPDGRKRKISADQLKRLASVREAYFRKMGYGKYKNRKPVSKRRRKVA